MSFERFFRFLCLKRKVLAWQITRVVVHTSAITFVVIQSALLFYHWQGRVNVAYIWDHESASNACVLFAAMAVALAIHVIWKDYEDYLKEESRPDRLL